MFFIQKLMESKEVLETLLDQIPIILVYLNKVRFFHV